MAGFTYVVSVGSTGQKAAGGVDLAPLVLREDPTESINKNTFFLDTEGILYLRKFGSADQATSANIRPVIQIANSFGANHNPRAENSGSKKFALWENGSMEFRPSTANPIMMSLMANYMNAQNALVFSNNIGPSSNPSGQRTNAAIDMAAVRELRLPGGYLTKGLVPPLLDEAGVPIWNENQNYGVAFQARLEKLIITVGNTSDTSGAALIPAGAMLFQIAYHVKDTTTTGVADLFDIGIGGDLTRFATGLDASSFATKGYAPDPTVFRTYAADTPIIVTLDGNAADTFEVIILTLYLIATVAPQLN